MTRSRSIAIGLLSALLLAVPAGCGGGGGESVTAAELVQRGDQICGDEQSRFAEVQAQPPANATEAADQTKQVIDASEEASSGLEDMEPPDELQTAYNEYLKARDDALEEMRKGEDAADDQDSEAYGQAQDAVAKGAPERLKLARSLGFKTCSKSPAVP